MTTVSIHMPENTGLTGFTLYLRKISDGTLVNTGGDALTESPASSGRFTATVTESWTETLAAVVLDGNSLAVRDGWLASGETIVQDSLNSGLSTAVSAVKSDTSTLLGRITSGAAQMFLDLIQMITGSGTVGAKFTSTALSNSPAGSGGTSTIVTLQSVTGITPGVIVGPSEPLVIGDDYTATTGRQIRMNLVDSNGDPAVTTFGSLTLADAGISIQLLLRRSGNQTAAAQLVGTCTFNPAVGSVPPYLLVSFSRTETAKAVPGPYDVQAEAVWLSGEVVTFAPYGQIEFVRNISRS